MKIKSCGQPACPDWFVELVESGFVKYPIALQCQGISCLPDEGGICQEVLRPTKHINLGRKKDLPADAWVLADCTGTLILDDVRYIMRKF